jgi:hypothetical protein
MGFSLLYRGNALPLRTTAVIGRSPACRVLLDGPGVSRRHARIELREEGVVIEDLGSANGVLVNGERIRGPRTLLEGDWLTIGGHSLQLVVDDRPAKSLSGGRDDDDDLEEPSDFGTQTQRASQLVLTGEAALEMIEVGLVHEAEQLLGTRLKHLLDEAREANKLEDGKRREAARFALELAMATGNSRWIEYVFQVFEATKGVMPAEVMAIVGTAATRVTGTIPVAPAEAYLSMLRDGHAGAELEDIEVAERLVRELRNRAS